MHLIGDGDTSYPIPALNLVGLVSAYPGPTKRTIHPSSTPPRGGGTPDVNLEWILSALNLTADPGAVRLLTVTSTDL